MCRRIVQQAQIAADQLVLRRNINSVRGTWDAHDPFERMVLNGGTFGKRILRAETVAEMSHNEIG